MPVRLTHCTFNIMYLYLFVKSPETTSLTSDFSQVIQYFVTSLQHSAVVSYCSICSWCQTESHKRIHSGSHIFSFGLKGNFPDRGHGWPSAKQIDSWAWSLKAILSGTERRYNRTIPSLCSYSNPASSSAAVRKQIQIKFRLGMGKRKKR